MCVWEMCGRHDDTDNWLTSSHGPVVMDGLSTKGDTSNIASSLHEGNVDTGYQHLMGGA